MSRLFDINVLDEGRRVKVTWYYPMLNEAAAGILRENMKQALAENETLGEVTFYTANAVVVINTAFDQLTALCRQLVEKGFKVIFVNPSPAMSDFLTISKDDFEFVVQTVPAASARVAV